MLRHAGLELRPAGGGGGGELCVTEALRALYAEGLRAAREAGWALGGAAGGGDVTQERELAWVVEGAVWGLVRRHWTALDAALSRAAASSACGTEVGERKGGSAGAAAAAAEAAAWEAAALGDAFHLARTLAAGLLVGFRRAAAAAAEHGAVAAASTVLVAAAAAARAADGEDGGGGGGGGAGGGGHEAGPPEGPAALAALSAARGSWAGPAYRQLREGFVRRRAAALAATLGWRGADYSRAAGLDPNEARPSSRVQQLAAAAAALGELAARHLGRPEARRVAHGVLVAVVEGEMCHESFWRRYTPEGLPCGFGRGGAQQLLLDLRFLLTAARGVLPPRPSDSALWRAVEGAASRAVAAYCAALDEDPEELLGGGNGDGGDGGSGECGARSRWRSVWGGAVRRALLAMGSTLAGLFPPTRGGSEEWDDDGGDDEPAGLRRGAAR